MNVISESMLGHVRLVSRAVATFLYAVSSLLLVGGAAHAQSAVDYRDELASRIKTASNPVALGSDLFGDSIDWYTGGVNFRVVDVDIPGNNSLPVRVARAATTQSNAVSTWPKKMGTWELELPYISAIYPVSVPWEANRCSGPQSAAFAPGGAPTDPIPDMPWLSDIFSTHEFWSGQNINVPGMGQASILWRDPAYTLAPTDGGNYKWVTNTHIQISCLPTLASGQPGEGYMAVTPDGTRYYFNWLVKKPAAFAHKPVLVPPAPPAAEGYSYFLQREETRIYASQVVDRFGNSVSYTYNGDKVTKIESSDGRVISIFYNPSGYISSVEAHGSTWTYGYTTVSGYTAPFLTSVGLPDGSSWQLPSSPMGARVIYNSSSPYMTTSTCTLPDARAISTLTPTSRQFSMTHPSGAVGTFRLEPRAHYRAGVTGGYCGLAGFYTGPTIPQGIREFALVNKTITGTLLPTQSWSAVYTQPANTTYKTVTVTNPDSSQTTYTLGTQYYYNEGKLLGKTTSGNGVSENVSYSYAFNPINPPYAYKVGGVGTFDYNTPSPTYYDDNFGGTTQVPQTEILTTRGTDTYLRSTTVNNFNQFAKPLVVLSSNVSAGNSKTNIYSYHHNLNKWVIGQVESISDSSTGLVEEQTEFYLATALPWKKYSFGLLKNTFTYNADGTLHTVADGLNHITTLSSWKRGFPRSIIFADSTALSSMVHDRGWVTMVTDANEGIYGYNYDGLGRLIETIYPIDDTVEWSTPTTVYSKLSASEVGMPVGAWRRQETLGGLRSRTYYDARWQPILSEERDYTTGAYIYIRKAFDHEGRITFTSYPASTSTASAGINLTYDALGRLIKRQNTAGLILETIEYLSGNKVRSTDAEGRQTTVTYRVYGDPSHSVAVKIEGEEGQVTDIGRDVFGKITSVTQSGNWSGGLIPVSGYASATRSFFYNDKQQLCRRTDPESGSTIWGYDNAGQIIWELKGQSGTGCVSSQPSTAATFGYDSRGWKEFSNYPGTLDDVTYDYDGVGNLTGVTNSTASWSYTYNKRNLIETEQAAIDGQTFLLNTDYNTLGRVSSFSTPGRSVAYSPDVWGRPTRIGSWVTGVQYHPNGLPSSYSLGSGLTYSQTLDSRMRPQWQETKDGSNWIQRFYYGYSDSGNLTSMSEMVYEADYLEAYYDGLNRLRTAHGIWGAYSYVYDSLNNLRLRSRSNESLNYNYNATTNRLTSISGVQSRTYSYNGRGQITGDGSKVFTLNEQGQILSVAGIASYGYDGNGRRIKTVKGGVTEYSLYDLSGRFVYSLKGNERTDYLGLGGGTLVEIKKVASVDTVTYLHPDVLGSPRLATNASKAVLWNEHFDPYGQKLNGVAEKLGYTGHVHDSETGYTYAQARFYDPLVGRFLSVDPIHFVDGDPFTFNRYSYANNNPYKYKDPNGEAVWFVAEPLVLIGVGVIAGAGCAIKNCTEGLPAAVSNAVDRAARVQIALMASALIAMSETAESENGREIPGAVDLADELAGQEAVGQMEAGGGAVLEGMGDKKFDKDTGTHDKVAISRQHPDGTRTEVHAERDRATNKVDSVKIKQDYPSSRENNCNSGGPCQ